MTNLMKEGGEKKMGKWSDWYPLIEDRIDKFGVDEPAVYQIALFGLFIVKYPLAQSPIIYIGSAPAGTLKDKLKDHHQGRGSLLVYEYSFKFNLSWNYMIVDDPTVTEQNLLERFKQEFGNFPIGLM